MMRKNKKVFNTTYILGIIGFMAFVPGTLGAALPQPLNLVNRMTELLPTVLFSYFWPAVAIVVIAILKIMLIKPKLRIPWNLVQMEKLTVASLAETIVEFIFLTLSWWVFAPLVDTLLKNMILTELAAKGIHAIIHTTIAIPLYWIFGTTILLALINFVGMLDKEQLRRKYLKFSLLVSLFLPVLIILIIAVRTLIFK